MSPFLALLVGLAAAYDSSVFVQRCKTRHEVVPDQLECLVRSLAEVSEQQMSVAQYMYIGNTILNAMCYPSCNLLVFGVGGDSPLWMFANRAGKTTFIEEDPKYVALARERSPSIDVHLVGYRTTQKLLREQINDIDSRFWDFLPDSVASSEWDIVLIDAPTAYEASTPGRLQPCWWTSRKLASSSRRHSDVFLHDFNREGERTLGREFFTLPFATQPLVLSSPIRDQHLAHWHITTNRPCLARDLARTDSVLPVLSITTQAGSTESSLCMEKLQKMSADSLHSTGRVAQKNHVVVRLKSQEDGVLKIPHGPYGSYEFAQASWLKSVFVVVSLRLGYSVLLADVDILFKRQLPVAEFSALLADERGTPHLIMQQDPEGSCILEVNTGFYAARASSWTARFISRAVFIAKARSITEQRAWISLLATTFGSSLMEGCTDILHYKKTSKDAEIHLLPVAQYMNGYWINRTSESLSATILHFNFIVGSCNKLAAMEAFARTRAL